MSTPTPTTPEGSTAVHDATGQAHGASQSDQTPTNTDIAWLDRTWHDIDAADQYRGTARMLADKYGWHPATAAKHLRRLYVAALDDGQERTDDQLHAIREIRDGVRQLLDRKTNLAAVSGYELGHDDAKAEAADNPTGCPTCASRSCDFCDKPHPTTRFLAEAAGHICQPCRDAADAPAAAATTGGEA